MRLLVPSAFVALGAILVQQKADAVFMLDIYEKISEAPQKAAESSHETEKAKLETFAADVFSQRQGVDRP